MARSKDKNIRSFGESESCSVGFNFLWPCGLYSPWNSPGQNTGVGKLFPSLGNLPNPGVKPRYPTLQTDSLQAEAQGKPKNTGVGSLCLHQQIFPKQESNQDHLHCRLILYQLSYEGVLVDNVKFLSMRYVSPFIPTSNLRMYVSSQPKEQRL